MATAWCRGHLFDAVGLKPIFVVRDCFLELGVTFDFERTTEESAWSLSSVVDVLIWSVSAIPALVISLFDDLKAKVFIVSPRSSNDECGINYLPRKKTVISSRFSC